MDDPPTPDVSDEVPPPRSLLDLPHDCLIHLLERCTHAALQTLRCATRILEAPVAQVQHSAEWRRRQGNMEDLCLASMMAGTYASDALHGLGGGVRGLTIHGDCLASASKDSVARLWGLRSVGTCFAEWVHPSWIGACAFSPDGELLATGCDDSCVRVWHTELRAQAQPPVEFRGRSTSWIAGVAFVGAATEPPALVSCSRDGELCAWHVRTRELLASTWDAPVRQPGARASSLVSAFDACGTTIALPRTASAAGAAEGGEQALLVYDVGTDGAFRRAHVLRDENRAMGSVSLDHGGPQGEPGPLLAAGGALGVVALFDVRMGTRAARLENACAGCIRSVALSGHLLLAGREPGPLINVWDLRGPRIVQRLRGHANNDALALDATRGRLACGGRMNELRLWELNVG